MKPQYKLRLVASDNLNENYTTVVIHIKDVNDNPPAFDRPTYETQITEEDDRVLPKRVLQVNTLFFISSFLLSLFPLYPNVTLSSPPVPVVSFPCYFIPFHHLPDLDLIFIHSFLLLRTFSQHPLRLSSFTSCPLIPRNFLSFFLLFFLILWEAQ